MLFSNLSCTFLADISAFFFVIRLLVFVLSYTVKNSPCSQGTGNLDSEFPG